MAVMAQFSASLGGPIGGSFMGASSNGLGSFGAPMQTVNPVTWSAESREIDASKVEISLKANILEGWHLYSQHQNGTGLPLKLVTPNSSLLTPNSSGNPVPFWC